MRCLGPGDGARLTVKQWSATVNAKLRSARKHFTADSRIAITQDVRANSGANTARGLSSLGDSETERTQQ